MIVGVVIVAQTLYSSTKDHLNEFATLRALGASAGYIHKVILIQAMLSALVGYAIGMVAQPARHLGVEGLDAIHHHDAGPGVAAVRADHRHVRHRRRVGDLQGDPHRSRRSVQPMTDTNSNADRKVLLEARDIVKVFGSGADEVRPLKGVDLKLYAGELTLLMGPSGSGKTTLLSILGCILSPTEGQLEVAGNTDRSGRTPKASPTSGAGTSASSSRGTICSRR